MEEFDSIALHGYNDVDFAYVLYFFKEKPLLILGFVSMFWLCR